MKLKTYLKTGFLLSILYFLLSNTVFALEYSPQFLPSGFLGGTLPQTVAKLYQYTIVGSIVLALFRLILAAFQYVTSEIPFIKSEAKNSIAATLIGIVLLVSIPFILNLLGISPEVSFDISFTAPPPVTINLSGGGGGGPPPGGGPGCNPPSSAWVNVGTGTTAFAKPLIGPGDSGKCFALNQGFSGSADNYPSTYGCHAAADLGFPTGTNVYAPADGTVLIYGTNGAGGNYVTVRYNGYGGVLLSSFYHLKEVIRKSGNVSKGEIIAISDNTGTQTTGAHLHMDVHLKASDTNKVALPGSVTALKSTGGNYYIDPAALVNCSDGTM